MSPEQELQFQIPLESSQLEDLDLICSYYILSEQEVHSHISIKSNRPEQVFIDNNTEEDINNFFHKIFRYLKIKKRGYSFILQYLKKIIEYYELNKNKINKKEFIAKIEEILKKIIERSFIKKNIM